MSGRADETNHPNFFPFGARQKTSCRMRLHIWQTSTASFVLPQACFLRCNGRIRQCKGCNSGMYVKGRNGKRRSNKEQPLKEMRPHTYLVQTGKRMLPMMCGPERWRLSAGSWSKARRLGAELQRALSHRKLYLVLYGSRLWVSLLAFDKVQ